MRSRDPEEMEEPTLRGSKELYFITLSHLETPAQRKPCGYKEGKCNRCNRSVARTHFSPEPRILRVHRCVILTCARSG